MKKSKSKTSCFPVRCIKNGVALDGHGNVVHAYRVRLLNGKPVSDADAKMVAALCPLPASEAVPATFGEIYHDGKRWILHQAAEFRKLPTRRRKY